MPRKKKKIKIELSTPRLDYEEKFQERVNFVYIETIKNYIEKGKFGKEYRREILEKVIERL